MLNFSFQILYHRVTACMASLFKLLEEDHKWVWMEECKSAFSHVKNSSQMMQIWLIMTAPDQSHWPVMHLHMQLDLQTSASYA